MGLNRNWTKDEEIYLSDNWGSISLKTLAKKLNRSENAVKVKVVRMDLGAFLQAGEYITWNQFLSTIGCNCGSGYKVISWIKNKGFPVKTKRVNECSFKVVYLDDFWKWADNNRNFIDWSLIEENIFGTEPEWVKELRRVQYRKRKAYKQTPWTKAEDDYLKMLVNSFKYSYREISEKVQRTEGAIQRRLCDLKISARPLKADNHNNWIDEEIKSLEKGIKGRLPYEIIAEKINKSVKAIRGFVYRMYLTENIDKVAQLIGNGAWGDNRPPRTITHTTLSTAERLEVKKNMTQFVILLKGKICEHYESNDYWQREMCRHWNNGCEAGETNCDICQSFQRIRPQYCKRCGATFTDRNENLYCHKCRKQRKKQAQRKYAILHGKRIYNLENESD
ncbi:MAG: hypothetical protein AB9836_04910 [Aminipila sp.]